VHILDPILGHPPLKIGPQSENAESRHIFPQRQTTIRSPTNPGPSPRTEADDSKSLHDLNFALPLRAHRLVGAMTGRRQNRRFPPQPVVPVQIGPFRESSLKSVTEPCFAQRTKSLRFGEVSVSRQSGGRLAVVAPSGATESSQPTYHSGAMNMECTYAIPRSTITPDRS